MNRLLLLTCAGMIAIQTAYSQETYKDASAPVEERVEDLLSRMTLKEKVGQICCPLGWEMYVKTDDGVTVSDLYRQRMDEMPIGSFWAVLRADPWTKKTLETGLNPKLAAEALNAMQKYAVENTRLGIPVLFAEECPHGHMAIGTTVFPTSLGLASTWDEALMQEVGETIALEARLQGAGIGYGPVLDIGREPRWSRMEETFGEDPVLTAVMGTAFVRGMQGEDVSDGRHLYATLKHIAAYGIPEGGHNGGQANVGMRRLLSEYLYPFEMAVRAGVGTVMTAYNAIDGVPCTGNKFLLDSILRKTWGFNGFIYSDLGSIDGIAGTHHVAADLKEAAAIALKAGVDMDLGENSYRTLEEGVRLGLVDVADIDRAVRNVLRVKFRLGLFENPYVSPQEAADIVRCDAHKELAEQVARESVVLLENNGVLPLSKDLKRVAVIGPNADNMYNQLGDYTAPQDRKEISTVLDGVRNAVSEKTEVVYVKGCAVRDTVKTDIAAAVRAAESSDAVILVLGGSSARDFKTKYIATGAATVDNSATEVSDMDCGEGFDRSTLTLLGDQEKLLDAVAATGKPLVVVYIQGRTLLMNNASEKADALLTAWYPGEQGGNAIADVIFGHYNPAGRTPVSIPRSEGQLPVYYSQGQVRDYMDGTAAPLYAFGYGLSYSKFEYSNLKVDRLAEGDDLFRVSLDVANVSHVDGDEVVQLYVSDKVASVAVAPIQLKKFARVHIPAGEKKNIVFVLAKEDLALYNIDMQKVVEPGEFEIMAGASSSDIRLRDTVVY